MISRQCKESYNFFFGWPKILTRQGPSNKKSIRYGLSVQLLILKRQNCCREDLEEEQNGVDGKCMYTQNKGPR